jgi:predicted HicB family RNase H-like nuclease
MITLKDWMECVNYRITEGSEYCWQSYGPTAYTLDSWDNDQDGVSSSIIFDTETQTVYQVEVHDYTAKRSYRYINPEFLEAHKAEATDREVDMSESYDGVKFVDLETAEDFLEKCRAIMNYEEYDDRVSIPIELPDDELFLLMKMAHERDITFNEFVEETLRTALEEFERNPESMKARAKEFVNG